MEHLKLSFFDTKIKKEVFKKINLLSYNNKDLVQNTWKGKKYKLRPELSFDEDLDLPPSDDEISDSSDFNIVVKK